MSEEDLPWQVAERATLALIKSTDDLEQFGFPERWEGDVNLRVWIAGDMCLSEKALRLLVREESQ